MTAAAITALIFINIALLILCGVLGWLWWDQRKTIDWLARRLVRVLRDDGDVGEEQRRRWLRAVESGDAAGLPDPDGPDE